ncbi:MAG: hypothetical protein QOD99_2305 [Chthoniobacter sp.]|jgi:hypothetical protein|nr:hypothetical protein [Chthoniobacter sp.]
MIDTAQASRFYFRMKRFAGLAAALFAATALCADIPRPLEKAKILPLSLDDHFQFRKTELFLNDPLYLKPTVDPMLQFERLRVNFGAVNGVDRMERRGHYFTFFWRADRASDISVRLEYRQENLGSYVQAREMRYEHAKGSMKTKFQVVGDDYLDDGRITAWRALLIEDGKIVGLTQSYLWN